MCHLESLPTDPVSPINSLICWTFLSSNFRAIEKLLPGTSTPTIEEDNKNKDIVPDILYLVTEKHRSICRWYRVRNTIDRHTYNKLASKLKRKLEEVKTKIYQNLSQLISQYPHDDIKTYIDTSLQMSLSIYLSLQLKFKNKSNT